MLRKITIILLVCLLSNTCDAWSLWGTTPPNVVYLGMWTYHFQAKSRKSDNYTNNLLAFGYHSMFVGTFTNSYGVQSFALGFQRYLYSHAFDQGKVDYDFGYRIGAMTGYDSRLMHLAGQTPVLPFGQLISDLSYKRVGWEVTYTGILVSTSFFIKI